MTMLTPGGKIRPKYCLWLSFPAKNDVTFKVKMNLVNDLPVDILADINMLEAFGYSFNIIVIAKLIYDLV